MIPNVNQTEYATLMNQLRVGNKQLLLMQLTFYLEIGTIKLSAYIWTGHENTVYQYIHCFHQYIVYIHEIIVYQHISLK